MKTSCFYIYGLFFSIFFFIHYEKFNTLIIFIFPFSSFAQVDIESNISDTDKIWGLTNFYTEVKYNFAFFDQAKIDWDSAYQAYISKVLATKSTWEYYQELKRFCALLKDGHTNIYEPNSLYKSSRYKSLIIQNFNKRFFVVNAPKANTLKEIIGSEVISINGEPSEEWARKKILPYINASTEHQLWNDVANHMFYSTDSTDVWNLELKTLKGKIISYNNTSWHTYPTTWTRLS
ncbi:MAG: hypothetical protein M3512_18485, partial [Bacteroidota bacterium]|nr:hypothetical protein [Bacteroidota bacterium]